MEKAGVGVHLWMVLFLVQVALWTVPCFSADLGATCTSGGGNCTVANSTCAGNNTCVCKDTHYQTNSASCLERITLGQSCTGTTGTQGNCVSDAVCDSGTCRVAPGGGCNSTDQCVQNAECVSGGGNNCQCNSNSYQSGQQCLPRIPVGQSCAGNQANCVSGAVCDNGFCRIPVGQSCAGNQANCVSDAVCDNGFCRVAAGGGCNSTNPCVQNATCSGAVATCQCNTGFYRDGLRCPARVAPGGGCTSGVTDQCVDNAACVSGSCQCNTGFYESGQQCLARIPVGQGCSPSTGNQENCVSGAVCDSGDVCRLPVGQNCTGTTGTQGNCVSGAVCDNGFCRKKVGESCTTGTQGSCVNGAVCDSGGICRVPPGGDCTSVTDQCVQNAECGSGDSVTCQCKSDYYPSGQQCHQRRTYGSPCSNGSECRNNKNEDCLPDSSSMKKCLCSSDHFRQQTSNICKNVNILGVQNLNQQGVKMETSVGVDWDPPGELNGADAEYRAEITDGSWSDWSPWSSTTDASFGGLTQGKRYTVSVTTRTKKDPGHGNVMVQNTTPQSLTVYTKPGKPGKLIKETHSAPDVTLQFNPSVGTVGYYIVTVNGTDANVSSSLLQAAFTLRNPGNYSVTIVAHSNGIESDLQTDTIDVEANRTGKVSGLRVPQKGSRWGFVTWMKPDNPNGEINAYTVKFLNGSMNCTAGVALLCSNCAQNSPEAPSVQDCDAASTISLTSSQLLDPVKVNVTALQPDVQYTVRVNAYNEKGKGAAEDGTVTTQQEAAPTLNSVNLMTPGDNQILVSWEPQERTGPTTYTVSWEERESLTSNTFVAKGSVNITGYTNTRHLISDLLSYWEYQVTVFPFTPVADPPAAVSTKNMTTTPTQPEEVSFTITQPPDSARTVILTASCPEEKKRNGPITSISFNATVTGQGAYQMSAPQGSIAVTSINCQGTKEIDVVAEAAYSFNVFAETDSLVGEMSTKNVTVQAKPPKLEKPDGSQLVQEVEGKSTTSTVTLQVCRCVVSPKEGRIVEAGIILCVKSSTDQCQPESGKQEQTKYGQLPTWKQFMDGGASGSYRVTRDNFHTTIASAARTRRSVYRRVARSAADFVSYTVGDEQCDQVDSSQYCNGPLPEDKTFNVIIWACTSEGCTESDDVIIVRTQADDDGPPVGAIVGAVVAVVVVAIIVAVIVVVVVLRRKKKKSPERPPSPAPLTAIRKPVPLKAFAAHLERLHKDSNLLFQEEFEDIQERSAKHSQEASVLDVNKVKNRYVNILPYDFSRVKLSTDDDDVTTDFINANYIPGYTSQREYIATQGPMVATFSDFWRMVWEQKSSLIVMLSDLQERGRPKVDMYWPGELHAPLQYDDIIVELTTSSTLNKYTIRTFTLHKEDQKEDMRRVVQYFIPGWEDYSANLQSEDVLDFISTVRQEARSSQGPIVVHCSAGVGRTGTFIALDFLKQFVEEHSLDDEVDIFNLVLNMRHYRPLMVQSEGQYVFIHDTLKVIIEQKIKAMQEEENHIYGNTTDNNVYGNAPDNIYGNTVSSEEVYVNQAFEPEDDTYQNADLKPTTAL